MHSICSRQLKDKLTEVGPIFRRSGGLAQVHNDTVMTHLKSDSKATGGSRQPNSHQVCGHLGVRDCGLSNPHAQQQDGSHLPLAGALAGPHGLHHQHRRQDSQLAQLVEANAVHLQEWHILGLNDVLALLMFPPVQAKSALARFLFQSD